MRTLLHRTGLSRGDAYTGTGQNLTSNPEGAGNYQVGSFYLDYASLFATVEEGPTGGVYDPVGTYTMNWDTEFSWIIADGRNLTSANNYTDPDDIVFGDVDEDSEDGPAEFSVVPPGTNWATIDRIEIDLYIVPPDRYVSAYVYPTDQSFSHPVPGDEVSLADWLDRMVSYGEEAASIANYWAGFWRQLRWPLHWALLRVPCMGNDEGAAIADEENDVDSVILPSRPVPFGGPRGLMAAQGGFSTVDSTGSESAVSTDLKLWEPEAGTNFIRRGVEILNFTDEGSTNNIGDDINFPQNSPAVMGDVDFIDDPPIPDLDNFEYIPGPHQGPGNLIHLRYTFKTDIKVRPNELIVFMIQSGRARLNLIVEEGVPVGSMIMGSPNTFNPACRHGPAYTLVHHTVTAYHRRG